MFLIIGVFSILIVAIILEECEWFGWSTILCIGAAAFAHFTNVIDILTFVRENAVETLAFVGAYVVAGVLWSFCKWFFYLLRIRDYTKELQDKFRQNDGKGLSETVFLDRFKSRYIHDSKFSPNTIGEVPKASDNKKRLISWMALWPVSFVGTLLNDPVRRLFNWIFSRVKGVYQKMANALFKEFAPKQS